MMDLICGYFKRRAKQKRHQANMKNRFLQHTIDIDKTHVNFCYRGNVVICNIYHDAGVDKHYWTCLSGVAYCHPNDEFNHIVGANLALKRCLRNRLTKLRRVVMNNIINDEFVTKFFEGKL